MASKKSNNRKKVAWIGGYVLGLAMEVPLVTVMIGSIVQNALKSSELGQLALTVLATGGVTIALKD